MKAYTLTTTLTGVLSDDYLYFEGTPRPQAFLNLSDVPGDLSETVRLELEHYFNDLYNLFLRKLTLFACEAITDEEVVKLQALLQELIKVKSIIENGEKADIMGG
jgi:hypothetical protein